MALEEQIVCQEILETNEESTPIIDVDPLLELFSTEMFDPSIESIEDLEMLAQIVGDTDSVFT